MKFKELKAKDIKRIKEIYADKSLEHSVRVDKIRKIINKSERTARKWLVKLGIKEKHLEESEEFKKAKQRKHDKTKQYYLVTWCQNDTPIHNVFFENMKAYASHINADIHVIAGRYKNPTSVFTDKKNDLWDERVQEYLDANRHDVHKYVSILSDVKIQPTAVNPMSSMEGITAENSCVIGHPRVQMQMIPSLEGRVPKMMLTTGACTIKNYTDSKAGKKGEFHHTLGFVIIEKKDKDKFFARQVTADDEGNFTDLYFKVKNGEVSRNNKIRAAILGDLHLGYHNKSVLNLTKNLLDKLSPDHTMIHDIFDGKSISHHEKRNPILMYQKVKEGKNVLKNEIDRMLKWIKKWNKYNLVVVRSNHDDFVDRWIDSEDWRKDYQNALELNEYTITRMKGEAPDGIIPYEIQKNFDNVKTLGLNDSFIVEGWELGQHGHIGSGGSRGSVQQYRRLNTKIVVGHYHTPERKDGAVSVGTSTDLRMGYNNGPSSWLQSHAIIHEDGKLQHINFIPDEDMNNPEFTTFE